MLLQKRGSMLGSHLRGAGCCCRRPPPSKFHRLAAIVAALALALMAAGAVSVGPPALTACCSLDSLTRSLKEAVEMSSLRLPTAAVLG